VDPAVVAVISNGLTRGIDPSRNRAIGGQRIVEETVAATGVEVTSDYLAQAVNALHKGAIGSQGIVECGVSAVVEVIEETVVRAHLSFPKIPSARIGAMSENRRMIRCDAGHPPSALDVCRQQVQVTAAA
jgi:hypothetical protein